jgi:branched-subunit amino acid transport protein
MPFVLMRIRLPEWHRNVISPTALAALTATIFEPLVRNTAFRMPLGDGENAEYPTLNFEKG